MRSEPSARGRNRAQDGRRRRHKARAVRFGGGGENRSLGVLQDGADGGAQLRQTLLILGQPIGPVSDNADAKGHASPGRKRIAHTDDLSRCRKANSSSLNHAST